MSERDEFDVSLKAGPISRTSVVLIPQEQYDAMQAKLAAAEQERDELRHALDEIESYMRIGSALDTRPLKEKWWAVHKMVVAALNTERAMSEQVERVLNHGIRKVRPDGKWHYWCIHCNCFLDSSNPYNPEHHKAMCPYVAIATCQQEREALREREQEAADLIDGILKTQFVLEDNDPHSRAWAWKRRATDWLAALNTEGGGG